MLDAVRDESSKDAAVRLVFEPKSRTTDQQELITTLLAHTSLESSAPINLTMVGADGRPTQKSLRQVFSEWIEFRLATVQRRTRHRLDKVLDRIHVLEGRQLVLLNIDEVIRIIRNADDPKAALIERFKVLDEPVTVVVSLKGWVRALKGHEIDAAALQFKAGDSLYGTFPCRTVDQLLVFGSNGRVYSTPVGVLPGGRGDGQPITSLIELETGTQPVHYFAGALSQSLLLCGTEGYGLTAEVGDMLSRQKAGKSFMSLNPDERPLPPVVAQGSEVACLSLSGRLLVFPLDELKRQPKGGRGLKLIDLEAKDALVSAAVFKHALQVLGAGRGGKPKEELLKGAALATYVGTRGKKGKPLDAGMKASRVIGA